MRTPFLAGLALAFAAGTALADQDVPCVRAESLPTIDGQAADPAWTRSPIVRTEDAVASITLSLQCVHTADALSFLVNFPDATENREHKSLVWDAAAKRYRTGLTREDTVVFKWNMEPVPTDITLSADNPYRADIWYWKSVRTDHAGYADDKSHQYTNEPLAKSKKLLSKAGHRFYLVRPGDAGEPAYRVRLLTGHIGDTVAKYEFIEPSGSRADVRAAGRWHDGNWTVEFSRRLQTGHSDDVQLHLDGTYQFGVTRYEIAGRDRDPRIEIPDFGAGEVGETLRLVFVTRPAT